MGARARLGARGRGGERASAGAPCGSACYARRRFAHSLTTPTLTNLLLKVGRGGRAGGRGGRGGARHFLGGGRLCVFVFFDAKWRGHEWMERVHPRAGRAGGPACMHACARVRMKGGGGSGRPEGRAGQFTGAKKKTAARANTHQTHQPGRPWPLPPAGQWGPGPRGGSRPGGRVGGGRRGRAWFGRVDEKKERVRRERGGCQLSVDSLSSHTRARAAFAHHTPRTAMDDDPLSASMSAAAADNTVSSPRPGAVGCAPSAVFFARSAQCSLSFFLSPRPTPPCPRLRPPRPAPQMRPRPRLSRWVWEAWCVCVCTRAIKHPCFMRTPR